MTNVSEKIILKHENYMRRCFELAKLGESFVAPNPMVGAVLVYNDTIIGEGFHESYGAAHAEVNCLNSVSEENKKFIAASTLYVSLEPCAHFGKTPPCADLIIHHKIPNVIISVQDNFNLVNGKGIEKLRSHNIEVTVGILETEGKELLKHFIYFHQHKMPYITLKYAQTKDGYIGIKNKEIKISNEFSQRYVHQLRAAHQAILVGKNTILADNPKLDVRYWNGKNPIRIVLGNADKIPTDYHIFDSKAEAIFITKKGMELVNELYKRNIISVLVEGGAKVLQQFLDSQLWNEAHIITANTNIHQIENNLSEQFIEAPIIKGDLIESISFKTDTIQRIKNPNVLFTT